MPNTALGFPYPGIDDDFDTPTALQSLAQAVNDFLTTKFADTGWLNLTIPSAYTGTSAQVRMIGNKVEFRGSIQVNSGVITNNGYVTVAMLPNGIPSPVTNTRWAGATFANGSAAGMVIRIDATATSMIAGTNGTATNTVYLDGLSYRTD